MNRYAALLGGPKVKVAMLVYPGMFLQDLVGPLAVFESLMKGSRNHMRAFMSQLVKQGAGYTPQYISQAELDAIVNSPRETGSV